MIELYTGLEMQSHEVYSQIITNYWCVLMFSSGMPVLYLVGFLYYLIFYAIYKVLILKYFQKATTFNQHVAIKATNMIHFAIVWHIIIASMMFSNSSIFGKFNDPKYSVFYSFFNAIEGPF